MDGWMDGYRLHPPFFDAFDKTGALCVIWLVGFWTEFHQITLDWHTFGYVSANASRAFDPLLSPQHHLTCILHTSEAVSAVSRVFKRFASLETVG